MDKLPNDSEEGLENSRNSQKQELKEFSEKHAREHGFKLQPNVEILDRILQGLLMKEEKYGKRYCPCRRISDDQEENDRIVCPCAYHEKEINDDGHCKCFLFVK